jgi:hypothetical protein
MSLELNLFLACSFAVEKTGSDGWPNEQGISDYDLAMVVAKMIEEESHRSIRVKVTKDPFSNYIPSAVRQELAGSDLALCLFTRRTYDQKNRVWLTSTFAISEGAAFLMQLPDESETHWRLFGLVEDGVDRTQLGMAFPPNKTLPTFDRMDRNGLRELVRQILQSISEKDVTPRPQREYLALHKTATIFRDGRVQVEARHRYRFTEPADNVLIPHTIWRVSQSLPSLGELVAPNRPAHQGVLRSMSLNCGHRGQKMCQVRIVPGKQAISSHEYRFYIEATGVEFQPGDELEYAIAWEYPHAFSANSPQPNSVGLRCGERGIAQRASLTIQFERDLDEPDRILESHPEVSLTTVTEFTASQSPVDFWHGSQSWVKRSRLRPCRKRSGVRFEVYHWSHDQFFGMAKVTFSPHLNYFAPQVTEPGGKINVVGEALRNASDSA